MEVYVARQPVLDKNKRTFGYELLFRGGMTNVFPEIDGDRATSELLSNSFFSIGIEKITGGKKALINFTEELLIRRLPLMFPRDKIMVEVLEDVEPGREVIEACRELVEKGYKMVLDDFFYKPELEPLIALAKIIKVDFIAMPLSEIRNLVVRFAGNGVALLAEKVETHEEFQQALEMGFEYFQGYFFSKPQILKGKDISPSRLTLLQIIAEANKPGFSFDELEKLIRQDVSISYKLLRYINSAYFRRAQEISSMRQAIVLLGDGGFQVRNVRGPRHHVRTCELYIKAQTCF